MKIFNVKTFSLRNRLLIQLCLLASILSIIIFFMVRTLIGQTVTATQDGLLNVAIGSIIEKVKIEQNQIYLDLPYDTFSVLGAMGQDSIFYRLDQDNKFVTGYDDMPKPDLYGYQREPSFQTINFRGDEIRTAAIQKLFLINDQPTNIYILIGQTQNFQNNILKDITKNMQIVVFSFFIIAIILAFVTTNSTLRPIKLLAEAVSRRGPHDLRHVKHPTPLEVIPLLNALNEFISRLRGALHQTENFIAEAAHHIRTPLSTVKSESELALRKSKTPEIRLHLRNIIRSVEQTNRSSSQLLEHAMVLYHSEKNEQNLCNLNKIIYEITQTYKPTADLRDIKLNLALDAPKETDLNLDRTLLEVAIRNLIDNAIKYSPSEDIVLIKSKILNENKFEFSILNKSEIPITIDTDELTNRFTRGNNFKGVIGTGLGLAIVSEAVNALGGKFEFKIKSGQDICAILQLPL